MAYLTISGKELITKPEKLGFIVVRINGSHHRLKHKDGRITTIPVHKIKIYLRAYCIK